MMNIKRLEQCPSGQIRIVFEEADPMKVYPEVVADCGLYAGKTLDAQALEQLKTAAARASARQRAVRIVSASNVSERELQRRLEQRGEDPQQAEQAVAWLKELQIVDDHAAAKEIVRRCAAKGYGRARARQELYGKGIPRALWDEALQDYPDMSEAIDAFLASRLKGQAPDAREIKKLSDALLRRGHDYEQIRAALRRYRASPEEGD